MDFDKIIREITEEVVRNLNTSSAAGRNAGFDAPVSRHSGSVFDMGPCSSEMRRETGYRKSEIGKTSAFECNYASKANKADFDFKRSSAKAHESVFDYQTKL